MYCNFDLASVLRKLCILQNNTLIEMSIYMQTLQILTVNVHVRKKKKNTRNRVNKTQRFQRYLVK